MPNESNPIDGQPWPLSSFLRDSPLWAPSGVVGSPAASASAGDLGLSFDIVSGQSVTPKLALGRGRSRGGRYERTGSPWTSGMSGTAPQQGSAAYPLNTASNPRRDRIVIRRDAALQAVYPIILLGTPAATPAAAALTQVENGVWDAPLFSWTLPGGSSTAPANILDERAWLDPGGRGLWPGWRTLADGGSSYDAAITTAAYSSYTALPGMSGSLYVPPGALLEVCFRAHHLAVVSAGTVDLRLMVGGTMVDAAGGATASGTDYAAPVRMQADFTGVDSTVTVAVEALAGGNGGRVRGFGRGFVDLRHRLR